MNENNNVINAVDGGDAFERMLENNEIMNDVMNNPVLQAPPIGLGQLITVENQPVKVEHMLKDLKFDENLSLKLSEKYAAKEKKIEGTLINTNTIKFEFDNEDVIDPETMQVEIEVGNPNKYNYLQIDNSPHSLIKSTKWVYRDKVIENINDYHVLLSFLNDKEYKSDKYNKNIEHFKNENEEVMPLTYGTREELLHPKVYGTEFIFNNSVVQSSFIKKHDIVDGLIDMRPKTTNVFEIPIFSYIFGNGPTRKNRLLPLKMFKGLQLFITLNEFAFFVPCFNATVNELLNVSDKDDINYESYYNFMSDYNTIKKMENLLEESEMFCPFESDLAEDIAEPDVMEMENDDFQFLSEHSKAMRRMTELSKELTQFNCKNIKLNFLETVLCLIGKIFNRLDDSCTNREDQIIEKVYEASNVTTRNLLVFKCCCYANLRKKYDNINLSTYQKTNSVDKWEFDCFDVIKDSPNQLEAICNLLPNECYISMHTPADSFLKALYVSGLHHNPDIKIDQNDLSKLPGNTLIDVNYFDWQWDSNRWQEGRAELGGNWKGVAFNTLSNSTLGRSYRDQLNACNSYRDLVALNNNRLGNNAQNYCFLMHLPDVQLPEFVLDNNLELFYLVPNTQTYISMNSQTRIEIGEQIFDVANGEKYYNKATKRSTYVFIPFDTGAILLNYLSIGQILRRNLSEGLSSQLEEMYSELILYLAQSPLEILVPYILMLFASHEKFYKINNMRHWIVAVLGTVLQTELVKCYRYTRMPQIDKVLFGIPAAFVKLRYRYEKRKQKKKSTQCAEEYKKINQIKSKYNVIVSREYDLLSYNFTYISYRNKDGSALQVSGWSGDSKFYILMDKREFSTHPPSKLFCYMPNNNVTNIFQLILSDAYKSYPTCRFSSRYNRKIKNYWVETEFGNFPKEINKDDNTSYTESNLVYQRLKDCFNVKNSALNKYNTAMDNNTQMYITRKLNGEESNLILFSDYANQHDNYLFGYFTEINSKCVFGINVRKLRRELKIENKTLKEFYIRMQTDIPYGTKDTFNNYEIYTFAEGYIHYDFDEFGNLKTGNIVQ